MRKLIGLGLLAVSITAAGLALAQTQALQPDRGYDPSRPEDRAFDPRSQNVPLRMTTQHPRLTLLGIVPVTSGLGSPVPLMTLDAPALRLTADKRWVVDLVATNNSPLTIAPEIKCTFLNTGRPVEIVSAFLDGLGAGQRVFFQVLGPAGEIFVDRAPCVVAGPMPSP
jgi:hypothetical protein